MHIQLNAVCFICTFCPHQLNFTIRASAGVPIISYARTRTPAGPPTESAALGLCEAQAGQGYENACHMILSPRARWIYIKKELSIFNPCWDLYDDPLVQITRPCSICQLSATVKVSRVLDQSERSFELYGGSLYQWLCMHLQIHLVCKCPKGHATPAVDHTYIHPLSIGDCMSCNWLIRPKTQLAFCFLFLERNGQKLDRFKILIPSSKVLLLPLFFFCQNTVLTPSELITSTLTGVTYIHTIKSHIYTVFWLSPSVN